MHHRRDRGGDLDRRAALGRPRRPARHGRRHHAVGGAGRDHRGPRILPRHHRPRSWVQGPLVPRRGGLHLGGRARHLGRLALGAVVGGWPGAGASRCCRCSTPSPPPSPWRRPSAGGATGATRSCSAASTLPWGPARSTPANRPGRLPRSFHLPPDVPVRVAVETCWRAVVLWADRRWNLTRGAAGSPSTWPCYTCRAGSGSSGHAHRRRSYHVLGSAPQRLDQHRRLRRRRWPTSCSSADPARPRSSRRPRRRRRRRRRCPRPAEPRDGHGPGRTRPTDGDGPARPTPRSGRRRLRSTAAGLPGPAPARRPPAGRRRRMPRTGRRRRAAGRGRRPTADADRTPGPAPPPGAAPAEPEDRRPRAAAHEPDRDADAGPAARPPGALEQTRDRSGAGRAPNLGGWRASRSTTSTGTSPAAGCGRRSSG